AGAAAAGGFGGAGGLIDGGGGLIGGAGGLIGGAGGLTGGPGALTEPTPVVVGERGVKPISAAAACITVIAWPHTVHFMTFPLGGTSASSKRCSAPHLSQVALTMRGPVYTGPSGVPD
ncbi:MAG TPA: hypothetical protein VL172_08160, partial [Kofleriaceae bacterium]|nr:hypothetical protein [Kofleriaceae bacterium]